MVLSPGVKSAGDTDDESGESTEKRRCNRRRERWATESAGVDQSAPDTWKMRDKQVTDSQKFKFY